jgi:hypothetical protein
VTEVGSASARVRYRNWPLSVFGGLFALFGLGCFLGAAFSPGKGGLGLTVLAAIQAAAAAAWAARCLVAPTVPAGHNGVRIRTWLRTRSYGWSEIDRFNVVIRLAWSYNRKVLAITLKTGETRSFAELNSSPHWPGWVDDAAATLN